MRQSRGYGVAAEIEKGRGQPAMIWCFGLDIEEAEKVEQHFIRFIISLFQFIFSAGIIFFSHNKSANSVFSRLISTAERLQ
jgi:hypothetical protein